MTIFDEQLQIFKIRETLVTRALRDYMKLDKTNVTITRGMLHLQKQMRIIIVRQQRIPISVMIIIRVAVPPVVDLLQVEAQLQVEAAKIQVLRMFRR